MNNPSKPVAGSRPVLSLSVKRTDGSVAKAASRKNAGQGQANRSLVEQAGPKVRANVYRAPQAGIFKGKAEDKPAMQGAAKPTNLSRNKTPDARTTDAAEGIRLNKRMADLGLCSRREADDWIAKGWVLVNGARAEMGQRVQVQDVVTIGQKANETKTRQVTIVLHKPIGYVSGQAEDGHLPAVVLIRPENHWREDDSGLRFHPSQLRGIAPAGRLDIDSTGMLVLTQDGLVARQLIGENSEVDKEYLVRVEYAAPGGVVVSNIQAVFPAESLALLRHGLLLDGKPLLRAQVEWQNPEQLRFVLHEGKKRQIRRMCEQVGLYVVGLKRIRMGRFVLGNLPKGQWRYLGEDEGF